MAKPETPKTEPYAVHVVGAAPVATRLRELMLEAASRRLGAEAVAVEFTAPVESADPAVPSSYRVVVALISPDAPLDERNRTSIDAALDAGVAVLPVLIDAATTEHLPRRLEYVNALRWPADDAVIVSWVLRLLGLVEEDRKVFLSYRQRDTLALADQLRNAFQDHGFDVFLDRFAVRPGEDFQRRLDVDLSDKAFVVLLESPSARDSEWVRHEVAFALSHHLSLVALTLPGTPKRARFPSVPEDLRIRIDPSELTDRRLLRDRTLRRPSLDRLLWRMEWEHARRLRRHRQQLVDALSDWLRQTGHHVSALPGWTLAATGGAYDGVYLVTPRAPTPGDLRRADLARQELDSAAPAVVAHNPELLDHELRQLNEWIGAGRNLSTAVHGGLRLLWGVR